MASLSLQRLFIFAFSLAASAPRYSYGQNQYVRHNGATPHDDSTRVGSSTPLRRRHLKRSYEDCSMANPNGNICRMEVAFSNGEYDVIQVKELDGRLFRISDLSQTWREYASVTKSRPQISFESDNLRDIKKCDRFLNKYDDDSGIGASLLQVEGFECTDFAKALIRRVLDKDEFPGNGNGSSPELPFDDLDDDDYGYRNNLISDADEDEEEAADEDEDEDESDPRNPDEDCEAVSLARGSMCKISLELEGTTYDLEAEQTGNREFSATVGSEGEEILQTNARVDERGNIILGSKYTGGPFEETTCEDFLDDNDVDVMESSTTLFTDSHGAREHHECTAFGESLLYYLARQATEEYVGDGNGNEDDEEEDSLINNPGDAGSEDCTMASPNGGTCQMVAKVNEKDPMVVLKMEELDNRKFTVAAAVIPRMLMDDRDHELFLHDVKVHKNGKIEIDGKSIGDDLYCGAVLDTFGDEDAAAKQVLKPMDDFPCTLFAQSIFRYLIDEELRVKVDEPTMLFPEAPSQSPVAAVLETDSPTSSAPTTPDVTLSPTPAPTQGKTPDPTNIKTPPPTDSPTSSPSKAEPGLPARVPTDPPTQVASATDSPTRVETAQPTKEKTSSPTTADGVVVSPVASPTSAPVLETNTPTASPTNTATDADPTNVPTVPKTDIPTGAPNTATVTDTPILETNLPTATPTSTATDSDPTNAPTVSATDAPTGAPITAAVTDTPTNSAVTKIPTEARVETVTPTFTPTDAPTVTPTGVPTNLGSDGNAAPITSNPTGTPTNVGSGDAAPITSNPTGTPTNVGSGDAAPTTSRPTGTPTNVGSGDAVPITSNPTSATTDGDQVGAPSPQSPVAAPTGQPTKSPTASPTVTPTSPPTGGPTTVPTDLPTTNNPTMSPTATVTQSPSPSPTGTPTARPTTVPSRPPTRFPTSSPTLSPTTTSPTSSPTSPPTTSSPTRTPTLLPTLSMPPSTMAPTNIGQRCTSVATNGGDTCRLSLTLFGVGATITMEELKGNVFEMTATVPGFPDPWIAYAEVDEQTGAVVVEETEFLPALNYRCSSLLDAYSNGNVPYVPFTQLQDEDSPTSTCTTFASAILSIMVGEGLQLYMTRFMT